MESLGVQETYDGREFWRNAAEAGRYVSSICQKPTIKAQNRSCREFSHLRYSWLACMPKTDFFSTALTHLLAASDTRAKGHLLSPKENARAVAT